METAEKLDLSRALSELLGELCQACGETVKLCGQLQVKGLSDWQIDTIVSELSVSSARLLTYAHGLQHALGRLKECGRDRAEVVRASRAGGAGGARTPRLSPRSSNLEVKAR
ncbi:MAG: hypothetical protein Kow0025_14120 [Thermodesulfovibrionales bacterium]